MRPKYFELLEVLSRHEVDFIVVGGVAAILEGAPITTLDLDVVYDLRPANLERLITALKSLNARYRDPAGRRFEPTIERLSTLKLSLLLTENGPLDLLSTIGENDGYDTLLSAAKIREVGSLRVRVLSLAAVIKAKEYADRDKDRAMLPVLRKTLELLDEH